MNSYCDYCALIFLLTYPALVWGKPVLVLDENLGQASKPGKHNTVAFVYNCGTSTSDFAYVLFSYSGKS